MKQKTILERVSEIELNLTCLEDAIRENDCDCWEHYRAEFSKNYNRLLTHLRQDEQYRKAKLYEDIFSTKYGALRRRWQDRQPPSG